MTTSAQPAGAIVTQRYVALQLQAAAAAEARGDQLTARAIRMLVAHLLPRSRR